jgi:hypothetical protein
LRLEQRLEGRKKHRPGQREDFRQAQGGDNGGGAGHGVAETRGWKRTAVAAVDFLSCNHIREPSMKDRIHDT